MINVKKAWYVRSLPYHFIICLESGELKIAQLSPFRHIMENELADYNGHDPEVCNGAELRAVVYSFYGLKKAGYGLKKFSGEEEQ